MDGRAVSMTAARHAALFGEVVSFSLLGSGRAAIVQSSKHGSFAMLKTLGIITGSSFLLGGLLGFVPGVTKDGMYCGIFMVNTPHNILHIATGTMFLIASVVGAKAARLWFQMFGMFYAALALIGFKVGEGMIFNLISNTLNDAWGHSGLALTMLLIGFAIPKQTDSA